MAGCEEDDFAEITTFVAIVNDFLLFCAFKKKEKVLTNFKLAVSILISVLIFGSNSNIRRIRLRRARD
jgi:hypothetical protein